MGEVAAQVCLRCQGAGKVASACPLCDGKGWRMPPGFAGGFNCSCSNLRCVSCGGSGRKIERVP